MFHVQNTARAVLRLLLLSGIVLIVAIPRDANAQEFTVTITVDENGNGRFVNSSGFDQPLPFTQQLDPGPGGLANALTYSLLNPPGLIAGDLLLQEFAGGPLSDVIRFNPQENCSGSTGCLVFYSDNVEFDALADIGLPTSFYANSLTLLEVGPEGNNGITYTPLAGQPGFVAGAAGPVTYVVRSDVTNVPEPAPFVLLGTGLVALAIAGRKWLRELS